MVNDRPGGFIKAGAGTLTLNASFDNTCAGPTTVTAGTLALNNGFSLNSGWIPSVAIPGPLVITNATVQLLANSQISSTSTNYVQVNNGVCWI